MFVSGKYIVDFDEYEKKPVVADSGAVGMLFVCCCHCDYHQFGKNRC